MGQHGAGRVTPRASPRGSPRVAAAALARESLAKMKDEREKLRSALSGLQSAVTTTQHATAAPASRRARRRRRLSSSRPTDAARRGGGGDTDRGPAVAPVAVATTAATVAPITVPPPLRLPTSAPGRRLRRLSRRDGRL